MWKKGIVPMLTMTAGALGGYIAGGMLNKGVVERTSNEMDKFREYYLFMNQWLTLKNEGKSLKTYFVDHGYQNIGIYGFAEMGNRLYEELEDTEIEVKYAIDQRADDIYADVKVVTIDQNLEPVDVIVVTALRNFDEIAEKLRMKLDCDLISLEEVIAELM